MILKLAWRNIWRNKRRTGITLAMIIFAVVLSTLMMSIKEGVYENMIKSSAGDFSGYAQIHQKGYWEDKTLDYVFEMKPEIIAAIESNSSVDGYVNRVDGFALAAAGNITKGSAVFGINVEKEASYNGLDQRVVEGNYIQPDDEAILIGNGLAKYLKVGVNDTLVLLGSGYQGMSAVGKYPIKGIVKFGSPELSKQVVFLPMEAANFFFATNGLVTSTILKVKDGNAGVKVAKDLTEKLGDEYEVMDWKQINPELVTMIKADKNEGRVFMFILYLVISFGIFGTMLMMMAERKREFGVLVAIGMKRVKLSVMVWLEVLSVSIIGSILGLILAFPVCYYFYAYPISYGEEIAKMAEEYGMEAVLRASLAPNIFVQQAIIIAIIATVISVYAFVKLLKINAVEEMRS